MMRGSDELPLIPPRESQGPIPNFDPAKPLRRWRWEMFCWETLTTSPEEAYRRVTPKAAKWPPAKLRAAAWRVASHPVVNARLNYLMRSAAAQVKWDVRRLLEVAWEMLLTETPVVRESRQLDTLTPAQRRLIHGLTVARRNQDDSDTVSIKFIDRIKLLTLLLRSAGLLEQPTRAVEKDALPTLQLVVGHTDRLELHSGLTTKHLEHEPVRREVDESR